MMIEHEHFKRECDPNDLRPLNQWAEVTSQASNLKICTGDLCNADDLGGSGSSITIAPVGLLFVLSPLFFL